MYKKIKTLFIAQLVILLTAWSYPVFALFRPQHSESLMVALLIWIPAFVYVEALVFERLRRNVIGIWQSSASSQQKARSRMVYALSVVLFASYGIPFVVLFHLLGLVVVAACAVIIALYFRYKKYD